MDSKGIRSKFMRIECLFVGISETEASPFLGWMGLRRNVRLPEKEIVPDV